MPETIRAFVHTLRFEADDVISVELRPSEGSVFPPFEPGSHIDLQLPNGLARSYSLLNAADEAIRGAGRRYVIGVLHNRAGRGGSRWLHEQLRIGLPVEITPPRNDFHLHEDADHTVLIAGGIGITPILAMARRLQALGRSIELLCFARSRRRAPFVDEIEALGIPVTWHFDDEQNGPPDLHALLAQRPARGDLHTTHYYACGPAPLLDAFERSCEALGYRQAHIERFGAVPVEASDDAPARYIVQLQRSGQSFEVAQSESLLEVLRDAGIEIAHSCQEGICGTCETRVLAGIPDHRDMVLSDEERASNRLMMVCVSGSKSDKLVLDL